MEIKRQNDYFFPIKCLRFVEVRNDHFVKINRKFKSSFRLTQWMISLEAAFELTVQIRFVNLCSYKLNIWVLFCCCWLFFLAFIIFLIFSLHCLWPLVLWCSIKYLQLALFPEMSNYIRLRTGWLIFFVITTRKSVSIYSIETLPFQFSLLSSCVITSIYRQSHFFYRRGLY